MQYLVNADAMKKHIFNNIISRVIMNTPGMEKMRFDLPTTKVVSNFIGLDYDTVKRTVSSEQGIESHMLLRGVINSIDKRVNKYALENVFIELDADLEQDVVTDKTYKHMVGLESEEDKEDDGNPFGEAVTPEVVEENVEKGESTIATMVSELIKEIVKADASEVTELAEKVVELSKNEHEVDKAQAEEDDEIFSTVDDEESAKDDEDKPKKSKKKDDDDEKGEDNPFADGEGSDKSDDNPFSEDGDNSDDAKDKENPFADDGDKENKEDNKEDDKTGAENQTKKLLKELKCRSFGLEKECYSETHFMPFVGLENSSFNNLAKYVANNMEGKNLHDAYMTAGVESETYTNAKQNYTKVAKETLVAGVGTILTASILNVPVDSYRLNNVELFAE